MGLQRQSARPEKTWPPLAVKRAGEGEPFVLLHGGTGSWTHWARNIDALARRFHVLAFDLPGYGASPDAAKDIDPDAYVEWVTVAVSGAADELHLAGFSFGGALAAQVAARLGRRIRKLTLLAPGGFGVPAGRVIATAKLPPREAGIDARRAVVASNLGQWMLSRVPLVNDPAVDLQMENIARARFDSRRVSLRETLIADLARIKAPVQIAWGAEDRLAFPSIAARAEICLAVRPDLRIVIVPGGGHWIQYEQAGAVNQLLVDFHASDAALPRGGVFELPQA